MKQKGPEQISRKIRKQTSWHSKGGLSTRSFAFLDVQLPRTMQAVYPGNMSAAKSVRAATEIEVLVRGKLHTRLLISTSHSALTPGEPVLALALRLQALGRVATGEPILKSPV